MLQVSEMFVFGRVMCHLFCPSLIVFGMLFVAFVANADAISLRKGVRAVPQAGEVSDGQVVTIKGGVICSAAEGVFNNAVRFLVKFTDANGSVVLSGMLPVDEQGREVFYANGNKTMCPFLKSVLSPKNSRFVEIEPVSLWNGGACEIRDFSITVEDRTSFIHEAFTVDWFVGRMKDWMHGGMDITSIGYAVFVLFLLLLYFMLPRFLQPWILIVGGIVFYSMFNLKAWMFLGGSVLSVYVGGLMIAMWKHPRLICGIVVGLNIGVLALAKYGAMMFTGSSIIVPIGISFYTLQAISYLVDVGRGQVSADKNFFRLALYLTYFPLIMQGPISRYGQLASQLWSRHDLDLDRVRNGMQLALWGAFKKMVIADRAAMIVTKVYSPASGYEGFPVVFTMIVYSIQIYADFSGCVDISRGVSQCFGIDLMQNFRRPYFADSVQDFWRRWHISLSSWLKDYVYIPLGGNRYGVLRKYVNVLLVFAISGLWHGTGMNFFVWGVLHGIFQIMDAGRMKVGGWFCHLLKVDASSFLCRLWRIVLTFAEVSAAWVFFRASDCSHAVAIFRRAAKFNPCKLFDGTLLTMGIDGKDFMVLLVSICLLLGVSILQEHMSVRDFINKQVFPFRWGVSVVGIVVLAIFGVYGSGYSPSQFIYMQF